MRHPVAAPIALVLLALAAPARATSTAVRVTAPGELIPGQTAQGQIGDYVLENALVRILVDDIPHPHGFADTGGNVIDAAPVGGEDRLASVFTMFNNRFGRQAQYDTLQIVNAGGGANPAVLRATGRDSEIPSILVSTDYTLVADDIILRMDTTLTNTGTEAILQMQVGDAIQWGLTTHFAPGWDNRGRNIPGDGHDIGGKTLDVDWVAGDGLGSSYGMAAATGLLELSNGSTWSDANVAYVALPAGGGSASYTRTLVVGNGSLASVSDRIQALRATPRGTLRGMVTEAGSGAPVEGATLAITTSQCLGTPGARSYTIARTAADGAYSADLPPGTYRVLVEALGRASAACATVTVTDGTTSPFDAALSAPATLEWTCSDISGARLPCKVSIIEPAAGDRIEGPQLGDAHALVGGYAILSPEGEGSLQVPPGTYRAWISRGIEYDAEIIDITLVPGGVTRVDAILRRVVDTTGWMSGDFHVHAANSADSGVTFEMRAQQAACEGLEIVVPTDHDHVSDMATAVASTGLAGVVATCPGNEVTTLDWGHINAFPLTPDPTDQRGGALEHAGLSPAEIFDALHADPKNPVVQVNHPRAGGLGYFDLAALNPSTGESPDPLWSENFDAVEVFNGKRLYQVGAVLKDWYQLMNRGVAVSGMGNTDTHQVFSQEIGYPRNFVQIGSDDPAAFNETALANAVKNGRTFFTNGPFVEAWVDGQSSGSLVPASGGSVSVRVRIQAAAWVRVDVANIVVNGAIVRALTVPASTAPLRLDESLALTLDRDSWIAIEVKGGQCETDANNNCLAPGCPGRLDPIVPPLYGTDPVCPYAHTNVVRVDVDGDGSFTPPGNPGLIAEPISDTRPVDADGAHARLEEVIRVRGRVTVPSYAFDHRSNLVYFQDESLDAARVLSGGMALYQGGLIHPELRLGDEIDVTGRITQFNGLTELQGVSIDVLGENRAVPDPTVLTIAQLRDTARYEQWEGMLVRVNGLQIVGGTWPTSGQTANITVQDAAGTQTMTMRVDSDTDVDGSLAPTEPFDLVAAVGQYVFSEPRLGWYQLMPRMRTDIIESAAPIAVLHPPGIEGVSSCEASIHWYTNHLSGSIVLYGTTPALGLSVSDPAPTRSHAVRLTGLAPSTTYFLRVTSDGVSVDGAAFTTAASSTPSVLEGPRLVMAGGSEAQVIWTTDLPCTSRVDWGVAALDRVAEQVALVTDHAVTLGPLSADTTYQYRISSATTLCGGGTVQGAALTFSTPDCSAARAPGWVRANPGGGGIAVTWEPTLASGHYVLERATDSCGGSFTELTRVTAPLSSFTDRSAIGGGVSCYRVRAETSDCGSLSSACSESSCGVALGGDACPPSADHPVISAIRHAGVAGGCDEFVEIYNPLSTPYDLGGHFLRYQSAANSQGPAGAAFADGTIMAPHAYLLVATAEWSLPVAEDVALACGMAAGGGHVSLVNGPGDLPAGCPVTPPAGTIIVDRVGWGTAACPEGAPAPAFVSGESIVRAPNDADGSGGDSNDNAADFSVLASFTPRTSLDVAGCASQGATRPREVSSAASREPLLVTRVGASLALSFQEMTEASGYHVYAGSIGLWYSHGSSADTACDAPTSAGPSGRRVVTRPMPAASLYFVVSAWNAMGEGETGQRSDGARLPVAEATCAP